MQRLTAQVTHPGVRTHHRIRPVHPNMRRAARRTAGLDGERAVPAPPVKTDAGGEDARGPRADRPGATAGSCVFTRPMRGSTT
jgi:hypothetical protein